MQTLIQGRNGVDIKIHTESVGQLIGHQLRIDAGLRGETGMGAPHDLKRGPAELDRLQPWRNEPTRLRAAISGTRTLEDCGFYRTVFLVNSDRDSATRPPHHEHSYANTPYGGREMDHASV